MSLMSYGTWILLEKPSLRLAPRQVATSKGVARASLNIDHLVTDEFYVMALQEELVLEKDWMKKNKFYILGTPTLFSRLVKHHKKMDPPLMIGDPISTIKENPRSPKPKRFGLDNEYSIKDTTIEGCLEARPTKIAPIKNSLRLSGRSHQQSTDS